jgi:predicted HAD superfamily phosphohydrolase
MSPLISTSYPEYLDRTLTVANLSLIGVKSSEFTLDTERAHFNNYSSLLSAAGFA